MSSKKMTNEERDIAARVVTDAMKAVEILNRINDNCETLSIKYGWDTESWEITKSAMLVGKEALGIAHSIGCEDGWAKEEVMP